jgi:hypothetical protein
MGLVRPGLQGRAHFVEPHLQPTPGSLAGGFTARQPTADYE